MVTRYDPTGKWDWPIDEAQSGDFVLYDDYAALLEENELLKAGQVDLERFRPAVEKARAECLTQGFENYCNELLALIDAHKGE